MFFEREAKGHIGNYLHALVDYWYQEHFSAELYLVVPYDFLELHLDFVQHTQDISDGSVNFIVMSAPETKRLRQYSTDLLNALSAWSIINYYARKLQVDHVIIDQIDHFLALIAVGLSPVCDVSGIYFRPTFHYGVVDPSQKLSMVEKVKAWRKLWLLRLALKHPSLKKLFSLDWFAVDYINQYIKNGEKLVALPEAMQMHRPSMVIMRSLLSDLGVDKQRRVFLLFGRMEPRKGVIQLFDALLELPLSVTEKMCILIIGQIEDDAFKAKIMTLSQQIQGGKQCQIIMVDEFVSEEKMYAYFYASDVILAPYQRHMGSSGILVSSAYSQKPILSQAYGLMGLLVKKYKLGVTVNTCSSSEIAKALRVFVEQPGKIPFDITLARQYANLNCPNNFASTILKNIL